MATTFPVNQRTDGRAIAALAFGVLGFMFPVLPAILAIWLGITSRRAIRRDPALGGEWMATSGLILGIAELVLVALALLAVFALFATAVHTSPVQPSIHIATIPSSTT
jgi:hypothetical protein